MDLISPSPFSRPRRARRDEGGAALVIALAIMTPMMIITGAMMMTLASHQKEVEQREGIATAKGLAASGAHHALALLSADPDFVGTYQIPMPGGALRVTITDWGTDGLDNDGAGGVDDALEQNILAVSSEGWVNPTFAVGADPFTALAMAQTAQTAPSTTLTMTTGTPTRYRMSSVRRYSSVTQVLVRRIPLVIGVNQALYVDDPLSNLRLDGEAFLFDGNDYRLDGTAAGTGIQLPALGVPGDTSSVLSQISAIQEDNLVGAGGTPSVQSVDAVDIAEVVDILSDRATVVWPGGSHLNSPVVGSLADPQVALAQGNLTVTGTTSGTGILIVDGDLTIGGDFLWRGIVLCSGAVTFAGGGNKEVIGGLMSLGSVTTQGDLWFRGNVTLRYSSEAVDMLRAAAFSKPVVKVLAWMDQ